MLTIPYIGRICDGTNMTTGPKTIDSQTENSQEPLDLGSPSFGQTPKGSKVTPGRPEVTNLWV